MQGGVVEDVAADGGEGGDQVLRESARPLTASFQKELQTDEKA